MRDSPLDYHLQRHNHHVAMLIVTVPSMKTDSVKDDHLEMSSMVPVQRVNSLKGMFNAISNSLRRSPSLSRYVETATFLMSPTEEEQSARLRFSPSTI
jgi:hypothetical protein